MEFRPPTLDVPAHLSAEPPHGFAEDCKIIEHDSGRRGETGNSDTKARPEDV
jgi:hypothetical protein